MQIKSDAVVPDRASIEQLAQMIGGVRVTQVIAVAAGLGIADLLKDRPRTDEELADAMGTHAPTLYRLMRALTAIGLVRIEEDGYVLTVLGAGLRSDVPERLDLFARYIGDEARWRSWGHLGYSIRTGHAAFPDIFGMETWEYGEQHPEVSALFNEMMTVGSRTRQEAILAAYDFSQFGTVVDVGGGHGQLLGAILQRHPKLRSILYDQPHVVAGAADVLADLGVEGRYETAGGSFFETAPSGGNAYTLKFILHDWDDEHALVILHAIHGAMAPDSVLLAIDRVLPEGGPPDVPSALMDLHMLVLMKGKERTESEFRVLYEQAGFRLKRIVPTAADVSIIEGVRA